jgi:hypothetical protein
VSGARALEAAHSSGAARRAADRTKRARRTTRRRGCATRMRVPVPHVQRRECVALRVTRRRGRAARYAFVFAYALTRTHSRGGVATRDGHTGWGWVGGWVGGGGSAPCHVPPPSRASQRMLRGRRCARRARRSPPSPPAGPAGSRRRAMKRVHARSRRLRLRGAPRSRHMRGGACAMARMRAELRARAGLSRARMGDQEWVRTRKRRGGDVTSTVQRGT